MRKKIYRVITLLGAVFLAAGIALAFTAQDALAHVFIRADLAPFGIGFLGVMLLLTGGTELLCKKTRREMIEENDERSAAIRNAASATAFEAMNLLLGTALVTLALLGYMNRVSFFTLIACYLFSNLIYAFRRAQLCRMW